MSGARILRALAFGLVSCHAVRAAESTDPEAPPAPRREPHPAPPPDRAAASAPPEASEPAKAPAPSTARGPEEAALHREFDGAPPLRVVRGNAAYYGDKFTGRKTASGERYDPNGFTAAHRTFSFGTIVRVKRTDTDDYTYVRVTDRGPFGRNNRIIDVSKIAARRLGMLREGVVGVRLEVVRWGDSKRRR